MRGIETLWFGSSGLGVYYRIWACNDAVVLVLGAGEGQQGTWRGIQEESITALIGVCNLEFSLMSSVRGYATLPACIPLLCSAIDLRCRPCVKAEH